MQAEVTMLDFSFLVRLGFSISFSTRVLASLGHPSVIYLSASGIIYLVLRWHRLEPIILFKFDQCYRVLSWAYIS